jgi:hypothetical protein
MKAPPPSLGAWLLRPFLPGGAADPLLGDLEEEFQTVILPAQGEPAARRWHLRQSLASVGPLLAASVWRPGARRWLLALWAIGLQVVVPLRGLEVLRTFILSQIPLKEGLLRSPQYLATTLLAAAVCLVAVSWTVRAGLERRPPTWSVVGTAWVVLGVCGPRWPLWTWVASLPALSLGAWVGGWFSGGTRGDAGFEGEDL